MNEIENKISEGVHYELTPSDETNTQSWAVRLLEGPHPETVIKFGNIGFEGEDENAFLKFNFVIESTPNSELTTDDEELQLFVADVLEDILIVAASDGSLAYGDAEESED